jgi:hypothetical protein
MDKYFTKNENIGSITKKKGKQDDKRILYSKYLFPLSLHGFFYRFLVVLLFDISISSRSSLRHSTERKKKMQVQGGYFHLLLPASRAVYRLISTLFSCIFLSPLVPVQVVVRILLHRHI